ncbi:GNAT family N-acetyltransferase [Rhodanobacter glycinis]|uniref:GNAT family N-acetyltransferase n=1 Tax=Rhodanobacter glycinis TaxID=582702 RepID=A0A502CAD8_9GAMM|nr:GNAT family N-acetyltransferase [Rhodanobacter glycinis]TPG10555.1 GNAT family N-acetyltransferase [Rhodanobacter glycinis]TPG51238.1 GNAT family N-acetyltransferase [Rhodanobacter glycinis]
MPFISQLEPDALLAHFMAQPPVGFTVQLSPQGMPSFLAPFDLLTTADDALRRRVTRLPLYRLWGRLLRWRTRFAGTTVSEYAPLPPGVPPDALAQGLKAAYGRECRLLVVKDIAQDSPLLDDADNAYANAFASACERAGYVLLEGQALAWVSIDFDSTDAYLARLSSGRRKNIRRKLRSRTDLEIEMVPAGDARFDDAATLADFQALFDNVYAQSEIHFDRLTAAFFREVLRDGGSGGVVFVYRHAGQMIGWNLCYEHGGKLIDKYVGFAYPQAREHNLYFVSWMHNLDYARRRGLTQYVAGWTDPEVKSFLGARMTFTRHAVYARNPLLRVLLRRLGRHFESDRQWQAATEATDE